MWWKLLLLVLVLVIVCFIGGCYAGGAVFLKLTGGKIGSVSLTTLWDARHLPLNDRRILYLPWSWCVTAAITFLPIGIALFSLLMRLNPVSALHGDARFANARELRQFEYMGEYKNTSKKS